MKAYAVEEADVVADAKSDGEICFELVYDYMCCGSNRFSNAEFVQTWQERI